MRMAEGGGELPAGLLDESADEVVADSGAQAPASDYMAPWLDTQECTACDECTNLNPAIFAYNDDKKAYIKDPLAGPYKDLVKAAEKCTAQVIHPGLPADPTEPDIDKWIARGAKYN
jgi:pyruvate-ferredoxin/flavodoxin oxidoreductase